MLAVLFLASAMIGLSYILGEKHRGRVTGEPYESGILPTGSAWIRFDVKYYLVAMFFVIVDVESIFIFAWAVAWDELGLPGLIHISFFIVILLLGLVWLLLKGGLEWGPSRAGRQSAYKKTEDPN